MIKINKISFKNNIFYKGNKKNVFSPVVDSKTTVLPNGNKVVLEGIKNNGNNQYCADYMKTVDKENNRIKEIRYSKKYNLFDAIRFKYEQNRSFVKDRLTICLDDQNELCGFYLINEAGDGIIQHTSLDKKSGIDVFAIKSGKYINLDEKQKQEQIKYFINFVNKVLEDAKNNHLLPR